VKEFSPSSAPGWHPCINRLLLLSRKEIGISKKERYGEIAVAGDVLAFRRKASDPALELRAADMLEVWYDYNPFGWMHANNWRLVYRRGEERKHLDIYEYAHLEEPLLSWFTDNLPGFDGATFRRLFGSPGDDWPSLLVWTRAAGA